MKTTDLTIVIKADASQALREIKKVTRKLNRLRWALHWKRWRGFIFGAMSGGSATGLVWWWIF